MDLEVLIADMPGWKDDAHLTYSARWQDEATVSGTSALRENVADTCLGQLMGSEIYVLSAFVAPKASRAPRPSLTDLPRAVSPAVPTPAASSPAASPARSDKPDKSAESGEGPVLDDVVSSKANTASAEENAFLVLGSSADDGRITISAREPIGLERLARACSGRIAVLNQHLSQLQTVLFGGDDIDLMLKIASSFCGCDLMLFDGGFGVISFIQNGEISSDAAAHTVQRGYAPAIPYEHMRWYREEAFAHPDGFLSNYAALRQSPVPIWVRPITTSDGRGFFLHFIGEPAAGACFGSYANLIAQYVRVQVERRKGSGSIATSGSLVERLLTEDLERSEVEERMREFGWGEGERFWVLCMSPVDGAFMSDAAKMVSATVERSLAPCHVAVLQNMVVAIGIGDAIRQHTWDDLAKWLENSSLVAGLSDLFGDLMDAKAAYGEALVAISAARKACAERLRHPDGREMSDDCSHGQPRQRDGERSLVQYDECKVTLLRQALRGASARWNIVPTKIQKMIDHDHDHETNYMDTLKAIATHPASRAAACQELSIHRNTLDYRIRMISERFGIDVNDDAGMRDIQLVLAAISEPGER